MPRQPVQNWLTHTKPLQQLIHKARYLTQLTAIVRSQLNAELAPHCQVAHYEAGKLKLTVSSAAWASRLRFTLAQLRQSLSNTSAFKNLQTIEYKIQVHYKPLTHTATKQALISARTQALLISTAYTIDDNQLRQALLKLANKRPLATE